MYRTNFHNLDQYFKFVEIGLYVKDMQEFNKYTGTFFFIKNRLFVKFLANDLTSDVTKQLPTELYSAEDWNLKKVTAVQVHHTRMANGFVFDTCNGKRIVFSGDTMPCNLLADTGKNADLLIHEATFGDGFEVCL